VNADRWGARAGQAVLARLDAHRPPDADRWGWRCFQLGVFMLPASALFAALLLFPALIQGSRRRSPLRNDRVNLVLMVVATLMVVSALSVSLRAAVLPEYSPALAWVGLGNWLPLFWGFWGFQPYVADPAARRRIALAIVAGTVPVVATGLGQLWFGWNGPWQILGGAVIWHLKQGGNPPDRLAGLFDYANIAAAWLSLSWPFVLAALLSCCAVAKLTLKRGLWPWLVVALLVVGQAAALYLTDSRNGWGALVLAVPLVMGPSVWVWLLPALAFLALPVVLATLPGIPDFIQAPMRTFIPQEIWGRLNDFNSHGRRPDQITRLSQWAVAFELIADRPWLGWGAAAFTVIYPLRTGFWHGHTHNILFELALAHGLPAALLLVGLVLWLLIRAARLGMPQAASFERAWFASALILILLHASDLPMYDSRVNIVGWILLAGLRSCRR
jgi:O-antigen ligase